MKIVRENENWPYGDILDWVRAKTNTEEGKMTKQQVLNRARVYATIQEKFEDGYHPVSLKYAAYAAGWWEGVLEAMNAAGIDTVSESLLVYQPKLLSEYVNDVKRTRKRIQIRRGAK
jgi:hypothetical protein